MLNSHIMQLGGVRGGRPDRPALPIGTTERESNDHANDGDGRKKNRTNEPTTSTLMSSCILDQPRAHHQRLERACRPGRSVTVHETCWMI